MFEADYSSALTILLRYPNSAPYRPVTFVRDALYLRDHLDRAGGKHIISKYSGRSPTSRRAHLGRSSVFPSRSRRQRSPVSIDGGPSAIGPRTRPPLPSPASYIRRRQAIDILLHDAAQAVYQQSERWGVNQAVRDAVGEVKKNISGLQQQSATLSSPLPRPRLMATPWSLDEGTYITTSNSVETREQQQRDRVLAQILDDALNELRTMHSKHETSSSSGGPSAALEAALTKIHIVKERLANVSAPLEKGDQGEGSKVSSGPMVNGGGSGRSRSSMSELGRASSTWEGASRRTSEESIPSPCCTPSAYNNNNNINKPRADGARDGPITDNHASTTEGPSIFFTPDQAPSPSSSPLPPPPPSPPLQVSRPSLLADSPFSWMLDSDKDWRSGFNAYASFPTPATERNRGRKAGYLFGEDPSSPDGTSGGGGVGPKNSFSMASLKGGPTEP